MTKNVKLMSADKIGGLITRAVTTTAKGLELIHQAAVQCMMHAEEHGDITLAERLMQEVKDNCKGVVVAGLAKWFQDYSPIKLTSENGQVRAELLKEGDKGYKAFDSEEAATNEAMKSKEVKDRSERPITKPTIAYLKQRIAGFTKQIDRFQENAPESEKMSEQEANTVKLWINAVTEFGNKVSVVTPKPKSEPVKAPTKKARSRKMPSAKTGVKAA